MASIGIISEYNPFHSGHKYQTDSLRSSHPDSVIVAIMSPNFVQRGEAAVFDKYTRGKSAVLSGVDVCLGMPSVFANLSAEGFAEAGVSIASALGLDALSFGVECDDTSLLEVTADFMLSDDFLKRADEICKSTPSLSLVKAREKAIEEALGKKHSDLVTTSNNILALEYIKAIKRLGANLSVLPIKRLGAGYKSLETSAFPSAMGLRDKINKKEDVSSLVPDACASLYAEIIESGKYQDFRSFASHLFYALLVLSREELETSVGNSELASRIYNALSSSATLEEAITKALGTRFTRSRISRALISALFKIRHNEFMHTPPAFVQLLALGERGREFLAKRRKEDFPIIVKNADALKYAESESFKRQWEIEMLADSLWTKTLHSPSESNSFIKKSPFILE